MITESPVCASATDAGLWRKLLSDGGWVAVESMMSRGLGILAMMFAAGALGSTTFGQLAAVQTTLVMVAGLIADALRITAARQIAVQRSDATLEIGRIVAFVFVVALGAGVLLTAAMYVLAPWIGLHLLDDVTLTVPLRVGLILLLCEALSGLCLGVLTGLREFRAMAAAGAANGITLLLLVGIGVHHGVTGVVWAMALASLLGFCIRGVMILKALRRHGAVLHLQLRDSDISTLWQLSLPALLNGLCFAPVSWLVTIMVVQSANGYHELGMIGMAMQWFSLLLFLPNVVGTILLPHLAGAFGRSDLRDLRIALWLGIRTNMLVSLPAVCLIAVLSNFILSWYGSSYGNGGPVLILFALAAAAAALQNLFANLFAAVDRMWDSLSTQLTWASTYLGGAYLSLQIGMGATGIAAAIVVAYLAKSLHAGLRVRSTFTRLHNAT